jgi:hypothetical protein
MCLFVLYLTGRQLTALVSIKQHFEALGLGSKRYDIYGSQVSSTGLISYVISNQCFKADSSKFLFDAYS